MSPLDAAAVLLFLAPIADWVAFVILSAAANRSHIAALRERAIVAGILAACATIAALFAWVRLAGGRVDMDLAVTGLLVIMFGVSLPALNWLRLFVFDGFREHRE